MTVLPPPPPSKRAAGDAPPPGAPVPVAVPTAPESARQPARQPKDKAAPVAVPTAAPAMPDRPEAAPERQSPQSPGDAFGAIPPRLADASHRPEISFPADVQAAAQSLLDYLGDDECSEVLMNGPGEVSRKIRGVRYHCPEVAFGDAQTYHDVLNEVLLPYCDTSDRIDNRTVLIEGQMELPSPNGRAPMVARVHVIAPPGVPHAKVTIAKKPRTDVTVDDMVNGGTLTREMAEFLKAVARGRATFVVSGPTGSGKTTLLQAMTHYFDPNDRIVVVEETPELRLPLGDVVYLKATLERPGMEARDIYTLEFWTKQANRMRMDRIVVGETRGGEMAEWLVAANSGAEGSCTTVHAESPRRTLDKILALASRSATAMSEDQLRREIAATVDVIVQCALIDGRHVISGIEEVANTITHQTNQILSNPIFAFDRARGVHVARGRPSDEFIARLAARGVPLNSAWFRGPQAR